MSPTASSTRAGARRRRIDGAELTGWFTEDFTWDELSTLRCRERLPKLRPSSASFDDAQPILRLRDVLDLVRGGIRWSTAARSASCSRSSTRPTSRRSGGMSLPSSMPSCATPAGPSGELPLTIESFESTVLRRLQDRGIRGVVRLSARGGRPPVRSRRDAGQGGPDLPRRPPRPPGSTRWSGAFDGISVDKRMILAPDRLGRTSGPSRLVAHAHERGLRVFTWTCRPENSVPHRAVPRSRRAGGVRRLGGGVGRHPRRRRRRRVRRSPRSRRRLLRRLTPGGRSPHPRSGHRSGPCERRNARCTCSHASCSDVAQPITSPRNVTR